ncbi:MAG: hypothetical protein K0R64_1476 [Novosphingobium lindaniclasticum]|jgi:porin|uniref:carbohydrate porin n=1 Tax=Novosphingobium lindaniclasticum TaxID=1329895 RepID=UPI00240A1469|nr:carbohydrate porin [Novosphingobium lindaniclasticum]MDF2638492.1 hypothetical protein [Novosphingobium lindaniclasticum]
MFFPIPAEPPPYGTLVEIVDDESREVDAGHPDIGTTSIAAETVDLKRPLGATSTRPSPPETASRENQPRIPARGNSATPGRGLGDEHLLGDWSGIRTKLSNAGVVPIVSYTTQLVGNARGGTRKITRQAGQFVFGARLDLDKIVGLPGTFQASLNKRYGDSFNAESGLNALITPQSLQGRGEIWRVSQFWYNLKEGAFDLKLGRMQMNEDFDRARCDFVGGYLCSGENVRVAPVSWVNTPISQWGARLSVTIAPGLKLKGGLFQYNPKNLDAERPLYFGWKGGTGVTIPMEISYEPKLFGRLDGSYTVGMVYTDGTVDDPVLNSDGKIRLVYGGKPARHSAQTGFYITSRQQLTAPREDGAGALSVFFNLSTFTRKTTRNESVWGLGMNYSGLIPGRPQDEIGIGVGSARINDRITMATRLANRLDGKDRPVPTREYGLEAYYAIHLRPGFVVQPGIQYIIDPGGISQRRNAVLFELATNIQL